ncbi:GumC family protein [Haliangium sp.]|uniref:GumC family protein n=1 Tax=Haliangium sp. TaxID=2663208 RepID=UPI003D0F50CE
MLIGIQTPRDKFDQLIAFVRRTMRYWWLIGIIAFVGGVLSVTFALLQKPKFMSETKIFYNERIQSSVLQGREYATNTRNLGYRYQEMLMSRTNMTRIIEANELFPKILAKQGLDAAIEEFKKKALFRVRGTSMFYIAFTSEDPELSQQVTQMMVDSLIEEDERVRREQASATMNFLLEQKEKINKELDKRQRELAKFLSEHPEFALDTAPGGQNTPGASIRAQAAQARSGTPAPLPANTDPRLVALERQRQRIKNRLARPDDARTQQQPKTPEQIDAERRVEEAERDLRRAQRDLEDKLSRLTPAHPDVIRAQREVADARQRVTRAQAQVPPAPPPPKPMDRDALQEELRRLEREISSTRRDIKDKHEGEEEEALPEEDLDEGNWVVALETEYARLRQAVEEQRSRLDRTDSSLSRAEITASQQMAEQGAVLTIIDPPSLPTMPQGKGRAILAAAGLAVFLVLGTMLALALALVDDRIYGGRELESLGVAPVAVVVPKADKHARRQAKRASRSRKASTPPRKQSPSG